MLTIAHITDPHIAEKGKLVDNLDSRQKFSDTLKFCQTRSPDIVIIGGDLSYPKGLESIYLWAKQQLDEMAIPYLIIPGNHDDPSLLQEIFNLKDRPPQVILTGAVAMKGESLMFLDTSSERLTMKQKLWLARELEAQPEKCILFMHHPPCFCGVPFMDSHYAYKTPDLFQNVIKDSEKELTIFCGHYHVEKSVLLKDIPMTVHITPPTLGCLDADNDQYRIIDARTGWREIRIENQQIRENHCFYLED